MAKASRPPTGPLRQVKFSGWIDPHLLARTRAAVAAVGGDVTFTRLLADGLRREVEALERRHHRGKPFPLLKPGAELRRGSRAGSGVKA